MSSHRAPAQPSSPSVDEPRFRGEPAVRAGAGGLSATFLPGLGLTGVSLRHEGGGELLALPGGLDVLGPAARGASPLLAPWANRLDGPRYRALGRSVDLGPALADGEVRTDDNGLPIHGLVAGRSVWQVEGTGVVARGRVGCARVAAARPARVSRSRTVCRSSPRCVPTRWSSPPRSCPRDAGGCRSRSAGTRTCDCRARRARGGGWCSRNASTSPSTPAGSRRRADPRGRRVRAGGPPPLRRPVRAARGTRPGAGPRVRRPGR